MSLGEDTSYIVDRYDGLSTTQSRMAFLRTLRAGVDLRGQVVTMLDRCYLAAGLPTMIIWGTEDPVIPMRHALIAHSAMPGSRLELFQGAGHFPHHDDAMHFVTVIKDFVATTSPATYDVAAWRTLLRDGASRLSHPSVSAQYDGIESSGS